MDVFDKVVIACPTELKRSNDARNTQVFGTHGKPATVVANQRNVFNRENAGRNICSAFHHKSHNGIGTPI